ncbi:hypothetical protein HAX54_013326, partial [Datura stramonium]|nr:hypothetical protein [Datura stramonium]
MGINSHVDHDFDSLGTSQGGSIGESDRVGVQEEFSWHLQENNHWIRHGGVVTAIMGPLQWMTGIDKWVLSGFQGLCPENTTLPKTPPFYHENPPSKLPI